MWTRGVQVIVLALVAGSAAAQAPPRDPIPPGKRNAARIAQLKDDAAAHNRAGDFEKTMAALEEITRLDPTDAQANHHVAAFFWEKAYKDGQLTADVKQRYIETAIKYEDAALALNADYVDALVYKNLLLRLLANLQTSPEEQKRLIAEADALRTRAMELNKHRGPQPMGNTGGAPAPPPPPPPPAAPGSAPAPIRVGGNITAPTKTKDVRPIDPPEAAAARVQGVVICEIVVGTDGRVTDAKVLRSIPLLDEAALEAVRQWEYTPTLLNGMPVPVIMTVTVNFTR
jgi:TonB family protein